MWPSTCHLLPSYRQVENWELCQKSKHQMMIDCLHFVPTPRLKSVQYQTMASVYLYMYSTRLDELLKRHFLYRMGAKSRKCDQVDQPFVFTLRGHSQTTLTTDDIHVQPISSQFAASIHQCELNSATIFEKFVGPLFFVCSYIHNIGQIL